MVTDLVCWWPFYDFGLRKESPIKWFCHEHFKMVVFIKSQKVTLSPSSMSPIATYIPKIRSWLLRLQTWPTLSIRLRLFAQTCEFVSISEIPFWLHIDSFHLVPFMPIWQSIHDQQTVQIDHQFGNALIKLCCLDNSNCDFYSSMYYIYFWSQSLRFQTIVTRVKRWRCGKYRTIKSPSAFLKYFSSGKRWELCHAVSSVKYLMVSRRFRFNLSPVLAPNPLIGQ